MTEFVYVRPNPGGRVRMPDRNGTVMSGHGAMVPRIDFYERLIITGDLTVCDPPSDKPQPAPVEAAEQMPDTASSRRSGK